MLAAAPASAAVTRWPTAGRSTRHRSASARMVLSATTERRRADLLNGCAPPRRADVGQRVQAGRPLHRGVLRCLSLSVRCRFQNRFQKTGNATRKWRNSGSIPSGRANGAYRDRTGDLLRAR
jgi:hypothetical protein